MPEKPEPKRHRGRQETRALKIDATPEQLAKCRVTPIKDWNRPPVSPDDKKGPSPPDMPGDYFGI